MGYMSGIYKDEKYFCWDWKIIMAIGLLMVSPISPVFIDIKHATVKYRLSKNCVKNEFGIKGVRFLSTGQ